MKTVFDLHSISMIEVPYDYKECSVCGKWCEGDSFKKEDEEAQSRSNCRDCYMMPWEDMKKLKIMTLEKYKSAAVRNFLSREIEKRNFFHNSISVQEMIEALQSLPKDARLYMKQDGYYSEGKFGEIFMPEQDTAVKIDGIEYFAIGYSSQSC